MNSYTMSLLRRKGGFYVRFMYESVAEGNMLSNFSGSVRLLNLCRLVTKRMILCSWTLSRNGPGLARSCYHAVFSANVVVAESHAR